jgi:MFS family permease
MGGAIVSPALPEIQKHFEGIAHVELLTKLVLTLPALTIALGSPLAGFIIDKFGRKTLLFAAVAMYSISGGSGLFLGSMPALLVGRAFLGFAVAGVMTASTTLIADYFTGPARNKILGTQFAWMAFGGVLYLFASGSLANISWRMPFLIYLCPLLLLPLIWKVIYEPDVKTEDEILAGSSDRNGILIRPPYFYMSLTFIIGSVCMISIFVVPTQLPFLLTDLFDFMPGKVGMSIAIFTFTAGMMSYSYGKFRERFSYVAILAVNLILLGAGFCIIGISHSYIGVASGLVISGFGMGLTTPNMNSWVVQIAPEYFRGRALGGLTTAFFLGQFSSPFVSEPIKQNASIQQAFLVFGITVIIVSILSGIAELVRRKYESYPDKINSRA